MATIGPSLVISRSGMFNTPPEEDRTVSSVRTNESISPTASVEVGDLFAGRFRVLNRLGSGGMGDVFKVEDVVVKRNVALKILQHGFSNANSIQRFQQEARAAGSLDHPNIARVLEFGVADGAQPYLVMEYCPGESLSEHLQSQGCLSELFAREVVTQISQALEHAHAQGIVHRDLKPANVILVKTNDRCTVKVIDFGIAKILSSDDSPGLTKTGEIFGSPFYMSPEQAESGTITGNSDQYSLGCLFYECLTGAPPHIGKTSIETLIKHRTEAPRSLKEASLGSEFSTQTQTIVERLLQKDPAARYPSIVAVTKALKDLSPTSAEVVVPRNRSGVRKLSVYLVILSVAIVTVLVFILINQRTERNAVPSARSGDKADAPGVATKPIHLDTTLVGTVLDDTAAADALCTNLIRSNPQQTKFEFEGQSMSSEGLRAFANHRQVTWLNLRENRKVKDDGMKFIKQLPLETLDLSLTGITSGAMKIIPLNRLRELRLGWTDIDDAGILSLTAAKNLEILIIEGSTKIEGKTLASLRVLKNLNTLSLNNINLSHSVIRQLRQLKLRTLFMDHTEVNDEDLKALTSMPIQILSVRKTQISDKGLGYLQGVKSLQKVHVDRDDNFSPQAIEKFKQDRPGVLEVHR